MSGAPRAYGAILPRVSVDEQAAEDERADGRDDEELAGRIELLEGAVGRLDQSVAELRARIAGDGAGPGPARYGEAGAPAALRAACWEAWCAAPLARRLRFLAELLPADGAAVLAEAAKMEELRSKPEELGAWLAEYPAPFVEAVCRLDEGGGLGADGPGLLARAALAEFRAALDLTLQTAGIQWIRPGAGERISRDHDVIRSEPAEARPEVVASLVSAGIRARGHTLLHARVVATARQAPGGVAVAGSEGGAAADDARANAPRAPEVTPPLPPTDSGDSVQEDAAPDAARAGGPPERADESQQEPPAAMRAYADPEWLGAMRERAAAGGGAELHDLAQRLEALVAVASARADEAAWQADLVRVMEPLLPWLAGRKAEMAEAWQREAELSGDQALDWLRSMAGIEVLCPAAGVRFDGGAMELAGTRPTGHAQEDGTVARLERAGIAVDGAIVCRPRVLRYDLDGPL